MQWIKNHRLISGAGALVLVGIVTFIFLRNSSGTTETVAVVRRDVVENVRVAGTVEARIVSDLGFETSGIVRTVSVAENDTVYQGQQLVSLGLGTLGAELRSAQASLAIKRAEASNASVNLETIQQKYDTLVANAYSELLSSDLTAEPQSSTFTQTPPSITGRYTGGEGTYKIIVKSSTQSGEMDLYVFNMETIEPIRVNKTGSTPIGTRGLFVTFPTVATAYRDTIWYIDIPNTKAASYSSNYNAYQDALRERTRAIDDAQAELRAQTEGSSIVDAQLAQAEAEVARIQALIAQRILTAPFAGIVTAVNVDPGESVSSNASAVSLISNDGFGVKVDLPEIDSVKVHVGDRASIVLDAISNETLSGHVVSVNRTETVVDGVSVYEARIAFDTQDERIASGMTADVTVVTDERTNVLAIPVRAVRYREDGTAFVIVKDSGEGETETPVTVGLRGSDGFVEVVGVAENNEVVIPNL